ncbi:nitrate/nitrite transporter [Thermodesulfobacteriota bacterium]
MESSYRYTGYRWVVLLVGSVAILSPFLDMIVYAPILGAVAKDLDVSLGHATGLMMGFVLALALVQIWGGIICDKFGIRVAQVSGLLCASLPATLMPLLGESFGVVFACRLIQGASISFILSTIGAILTDWFPPEEEGLAGGILFGAVGLGSTIGVVASPALFAATGSWQVTVAILSAPGWLGIVLSLLFSGRKPVTVIAPISGPSTGQAEELTFRKALALPMTWVGVLVVGANSCGLFGLYNLTPPYLSAETPIGVGLDTMTAGKLSIAVTAVGILAPLVGGIFLDKVVKGNCRIAMVIGFALTGIFTFFVLLPGVYGSFGLLVACLMLAGWGIPFMNPSISAFIATNYPPKIVGRMIGLWFGFGALCGALALHFGGWSIHHHGTFYWALGMISITSIVGLFMSLLLRSRVAPEHDRAGAT